MTTTAFRIDLIELAMGMKRLISESTTPMTMRISAMWTITGKTWHGHLPDHKRLDGGEYRPLRRKLTRKSAVKPSRLGIYRLA